MQYKGFTIQVEQLTDPYDNSYFKAWAVGFEDYYSIGNSQDRALGYLKSAIDLRSDIYFG